MKGNKKKFYIERIALMSSHSNMSNLFVCRFFDSEIFFFFFYDSNQSIIMKNYLLVLETYDQTPTTLYFLRKKKKKTKTKQEKRKKEYLWNKKATLLIRLFLQSRIVLLYTRCTLYINVSLIYSLYTFDPLPTHLPTHFVIINTFQF